jgi:hypothetical protein
MRTRAQRLSTANEVKLQCIEHQLSDDLGTRVLYTMLDRYVNTGETYIGKEIRLVKRYDRPRYYLVNLYNDTNKKDTVLIRDGEPGSN